MFVSDELIYIRLQKTASTHIAAVLHDVLGGELVGEHQPATPCQLASGRRVLSSIRNPWEWYLSLWAYGRDGRGALAYRLTHRSPRIALKHARRNPRRALRACADELVKDSNAWRALYEASDLVGSFRAWLRMIHEPGNGRFMGEDYGVDDVASRWGFMTHRYLNACCLRGGQRAKEWPADAGRLLAFDRDHCYVHRFVRQEALEESLCAAIEEIRPLSAAERAKIFAAGRTNASRAERDAAELYDTASIELVARRDALIIEKFGYSPP